MTKFGGTSGKKAIKCFTKFGYKIIRQKGSHVRLKHLDSSTHQPLTIPLHKELKVGLLKQLIKDSRISEEDFFEVL